MDFRHNEWDGKSGPDYVLPLSIAELLRDDVYAGYTVDENRDNWLNEVDLSIYDALLIVSPVGPDFSNEELNAITNYVKNGRGLLLTVDTQMYLEIMNQVPNQLAEQFGVTFFSDFYSYESIVNFEHPITRDMKQEDLFNPFLYWDAAIRTYPSDAVVLVDVLERKIPANSSSPGTLKASVSSDGETIYPAMIAMYFGKGRAVFGPANGLTQPWGAGNDYDLPEPCPNKMLLNTIKWLIGEKIPDDILNAEEELYASTYTAIQDITDTYVTMAAQNLQNVYRDAITLAVQWVVRLPKADKDAFIEIMQSWLREIAFTLGSEEIGTVEESDVSRITREKLRNSEGLLLTDAIKISHEEFMDARVVPNPNYNEEAIISDVNAVNFVIKVAEYPRKLHEVEARFNQLEDFRQHADEADMFAMLTETSIVATAPWLLWQLPVIEGVRKGIQITEFGSDAGAYICLNYLIGDVYLEELKLFNIYYRELQRVLNAIETGSLPRGSAKIVDIILPEKYTPNSMLPFGATVINDGELDLDARLIVTLKVSEGNLVLGPYYGQTITIPCGMEAQVFCDIVLPYHGGIHREYNAFFYVEYGYLSLEQTTGPLERSLKIEKAVIEFQKSVVLIPSHSTDVTVQISVRNNSGSDDDFIVTDTIPKELAASVYDIEFITTPYLVVEGDPVVQWSLYLPDGASAEIVYKVHTSLSPMDVEWLPLPAATITSSHNPDQTSVIFFGDEETLTKAIDKSLLRLKNTINNLPANAFYGGEQQADDDKEALSERIDELQASIHASDFKGALASLRNLFMRGAGGEPSIDDWITDEDAQSLILAVMEEAKFRIGLITLIQRDNAPPTTTILLSGTLGADDWYVTDVTVHLSAADNEGGSGVTETEYSLDDGETWEVYSGSFIVSEGITKLMYKSTDNAGNIEEAQRREVRVDKTPPNTSASLGGTAGNPPWFVSDVVVTLSATEKAEGSGVKLIEYAVDGVIWCEYSSPITISSEGMTTISFRSKDVAGNTEDAKSEQVYIDKTPPEARISFDKTTSKIIVSGSDNIGGDVDVEILSDSIDHAGTETFVYELTDDAGNNMMLSFERTTQEADGGDRLSSVKVLEIGYNDGDPIAPVSNDYEAKFAMDKKTGELKHLTCKINIGDTAIMSKYNGQKDETTITLKDDEPKEEKVTLRGLVIVELVTDSGKINFRY